MLIREMTEQECREALGRRSVARLACARSNQPYIVPVHVDLEGEFLYGFATLGQKIEWMRLNPLVCLEVDEFMTDGQWISVVVFGHYEELPHTPEYDGPRSVAERLFQRHPVWWQPASIPLATHEQRTPIVFRIRIGRVSGRRAAPDVLKTAHVQGNASEARRPSWLARVLRGVMQRLKTATVSPDA
jgi:nitroimidazol reductase NimA-like FMN-containing flavoprotein (pyridoxamine 5'-phosphate oxidase superfamily)